MSNRARRARGLAWFPRVSRFLARGRRPRGVRRLAVAWSGVAALLLAAPGTGGAAAEALLTPKEAVLENGLRVLTLEDPGATVAAFQVWYAVGSRDESAGRTGVAHLFEHLMFQGTKRVEAGELTRRIRETGGMTSAFTTADASVFTSIVPPEELDLCARLEADRMRNLVLTRETLEEQRALVHRERALTVDSRPVSRAVESMTALAYTEHPYRFPLLGEPGDLDALTVKELRAFYDRHYRPDRATLVVCGPVAHDRVVEIARRHFGDLEASGETRVTPPPDPEQSEERRDVVHGPTDLPVLIVGFKAPPEGSPDTAVLEVTSRILAHGSASRLHRQLVEATDVAVSAGGAITPRLDPGLLYAFAAARPEADAIAVEEGFFEAVRRLGAEGPSEEELARARVQAEVDYLLHVESPEGRARAVGNAASIGGDAGLAAGRIERLRSVSAADVKRVVSEYLTPERRTVVWLLPDEEEGS